ncbi:sulfatase family protein [Sphingobacterium haloxyli]|uniref:Heparan N-sulfatase n=1 Tax=Sphingobacterium haloxyli TaxID=2100533 RepID=A0A2S9J893_9SPHI|nr:sulfatase [Sphingobacterium haloxyli]PRD49015.1 heparan N-sulfatase [Sphingobacterium haloxyli]
MKNIILYIIAIGLLCYSNKSHAQTAKPNFIFFITDDIGWNDVGCYGDPNVNTPNIDSLASIGVKFENAYLTTSSCSPSRASIITGRYPHNTGAPELHDPLPKGQLMFPQLLKKAGYYTVLSGKNHMGPQTKHAFDTISPGKGPGGEEDWNEIIQSRPKDKPFFFWFASNDAHRDWQINDKGALYNPDDIIMPPMLYNGPKTREDLAAYYHEVSRADYYLGELIRELKKQNILENTYIIFMSDNGRPFPRSKGRLYDSGIKTPFIVFGPSVDRGTTQALISAVDIAPTILHLAGAEISDSMQGLSFRPILENREKFDHRDFAFAEHNWHVFQAHERMVRYKDWVYIRNAFPERQNLLGESTRQFPAGKELWEAHDKGLTAREQEDVFLVPREGEELYDLSADPHQFKNLAADRKYEEALHYLGRVLDQWVEETGDSVPKSPTPDRDDVYGKRLPGKWKKGERAGASKQAERINAKGPTSVNDVR